MRIYVELPDRSGDCRSITENLLSRGANGSFKLRCRYAPPAPLILYRPSDLVTAICCRNFQQTCGIKRVLKRPALVRLGEGSARTRNDAGKILNK